MVNYKTFLVNILLSVRVKYRDRSIKVIAGDLLIKAVVNIWRNLFYV